MRRLWKRLLRAIAAAIARWANAVLADVEPSPAPDPSEGPPPHWLERVQRDAPQLLTPVGDEGSPQRIVANAPEPDRLRTRPVVPRASAARAPSDTIRQSPAVEESARAPGGPIRSRDDADDDPRAIRSRRDPLPRDIPPRTSRSRSHDVPEPRVRVSGPSAAGSIQRKTQGPERSQSSGLRLTPQQLRDTARRPQAPVIAPSDHGGPEGPHDDNEPVMLEDGDVDRRVAPPSRPEADSVVDVAVEADLSIDAERDGPPATPSAPFESSSPAAPPASIVRVPARAAIARILPVPASHAAPTRVPGAAAPWPSERHDDRDAPAVSSVPESRWPDLPREEPAAPPDWTHVLSTIRRARSLDQEHRGDS